MNRFRLKFVVNIFNFPLTPMPIPQLVGSRPAWSSSPRDFGDLPKWWHALCPENLCFILILFSHHFGLCLLIGQLKPLNRQLGGTNAILAKWLNELDVNKPTVAKIVEEAIIIRCRAEDEFARVEKHLAEQIQPGGNARQNAQLKSENLVYKFTLSCFQFFIW